KVNAIIFRMRAVPAMDATVMHTLNNVYETCKSKNITLIFSHVMEQPMSVMKKDGFVAKIGEENFAPNIDAALKRAGEIA
ncbi:MAG: sodium-independent anion transporter, partial [Lachnospiraceae bacterium]|nr:sodium-independent anion transporter [Lachnospiraceae bacterium]